MRPANQTNSIESSAVLLSCGFSLHDKSFRLAYPNGLKHYLFRLQTEGHCIAYVNGEMQRIEAGDLLLYQPGDPYVLEVEEESQVASGDYYVICRGEWLDEWWARMPRKSKSNIIPDDRLLSIWRAMILEKRRFHEENHEMTGYLLRALCLGIDRALQTKIVHRGKSYVTTRMKNFIDEHLTIPFKIEQIANHVELSVSRTVHLFKETFGLSIVQYTHQARLALAEERIRYTRMSLEQIAETCGFGSYSYFYRIFRKQYKMTPAEYRQQYS